MAVFNVNQNRQFFVVNKTDEMVTKNYALENQFAFLYKGEGGLLRTDLVDNDKVCYVRLTKPEEMRKYLKKATLTLSADVNGGAPISGQDYTVRLHINNYLAPGDANVLIKVGAVHATKGMTAAQFYEKMAESLKTSFAREPYEIFKFTHSDSGVVIEALDNEPYRRGVLSKDAVNFEVFPTTVTYEGDETVWGTVVMDKAGNSKFIGNGYTVADLEYFCMAERGDMFRNMGWPNNIDVKYRVDPTKEYYMLDIHYFYSGPGVQTHKSEKDITIVSANEDIIKNLAMFVQNTANVKIIHKDGTTVNSDELTAGV